MTTETYHKSIDIGTYLEVYLPRFEGKVVPYQEDNEGIWCHILECIYSKKPEHINDAVIYIYFEEILPKHG